MGANDRQSIFKIFLTLDAIEKGCNGLKVFTGASKRAIIR